MVKPLFPRQKPVPLKFYFDDMSAWDWFEIVEGVAPVPGRRVYVTSTCSVALAALGLIQPNGGWRFFDLIAKNEIYALPGLPGQDIYVPIPEPTHWSYGGDAWFWKPFDEAGVMVEGATPMDAVRTLASKIRATEYRPRQRMAAD